MLPWFPLDLYDASRSADSRVREGFRRLAAFVEAPRADFDAVLERCEKPKLDKPPAEE